MTLAFAVAADAPTIAADINAWSAARPLMFENVAQSWTSEMVLREITNEVVGIWKDTNGVVRGVVIGGLTVEYNSGSNTTSTAFEFRMFGIDPSVQVSPVANVIDAIKTYALNHGVTRLIGWVRDDSPVFAYLAARCQVIATRVDEQSGHTYTLFERQAVGTVG